MQLRNSLSEFSRRLRGRLRRIILRTIGQPIKGVRFVNVVTAKSIAASYQNVKATTLIELDGRSDLSPKHLPEDNSSSLQQFNIGCETVLFDITNKSFSFRNNLLLDGNLMALFADTLTE